MSEEVANQVITKKNEGRVAAGKRLAEWNRKNKADIQQKNVGKGTSPDDQEPVAVPHKSMDNVYIYGVGTLAVLVVGVGVWYKFGRGGKNDGEPHKPTPEPQQKGKAQPEFFKML